MQFRYEQWKLSTLWSCWCTKQTKQGQKKQLVVISHLPSYLSCSRPINGGIWCQVGSACFFCYCKKLPTLGDDSYKVSALHYPKVYILFYCESPHIIYPNPMLQWRIKRKIRRESPALKQSPWRTKEFSSRGLGALLLCIDFKVYKPMAGTTLLGHSATRMLTQCSIMGNLLWLPNHHTPINICTRRTIMDQTNKCQGSLKFKRRVNTWNVWPKKT